MLNVVVCYEMPVGEGGGALAWVLGCVALTGGLYVFYLCGGLVFRVLGFYGDMICAWSTIPSCLKRRPCSSIRPVTSPRGLRPRVSWV